MELPNLAVDDHGVIYSTQHTDGIWTSNEASEEIAKRCNEYPKMKLEIERLKAALSMTREGVDASEAMRIQNCQS